MNEQLQWFLLGWLLIVSGVALVFNSNSHDESAIWIGLLGCAHVIVGVLIIIGPFVLRMVRL